MARSKTTLILSMSMMKLPAVLMLNTAFLFLLFLSLHLNINYTANTSAAAPNLGAESEVCDSLHDHTDKCRYVETHPACKPRGYINYLRVFYCHLGATPLLGHVVLLACLLVLFYLLANTAADYFCPSLEILSKTLRLSPTISGITLLSLGNGAPDVFAAVISFTRSGDASLGLNSVLGGAFFVSSVVVGVISIVTTTTSSLDRAGFVRDVAFFLFALSSLLLIFIVGRINLFGAVAFFSIYFLYVCSVSAAHFFCENRSDEITLSTPLLCQKTPVQLVDNELEDKCSDDRLIKMSAMKIAIRLLELPLYLPRRMTIPMATEELWSKPYAVVSVTMAPVLMAFLCNTQRENVEPRTALVTYMAAVLVGLVLGNLSYVTTSRHGPPRQCLFPWLVAGFLMSVTWTYIAAEELVSLLFSLGSVFGVSASVLGLTVLAWGNSVGDMISNVAMAVRGGPDGAQIAMSGCYAGPMFNTVVGIGFSLVFSAWSEYPNAYEVPSQLDRSLYETLGFLMVGLVWALLMLPSSNMRLDRRLGVGLLAIYSCFLLVRLTGVFSIVDQTTLELVGK